MTACPERSKPGPATTLRLSRGVSRGYSMTRRFWSPQETPCAMKSKRKTAAEIGPRGAFVLDTASLTVHRAGAYDH